MIQELVKNNFTYIKMVCPHCGTTFNNLVSCNINVCNDIYGDHKIITVYCTDCDRPIILLKSTLIVIKAKEEMGKNWIKSVENFYGRKVKSEHTITGVYDRLSKFEQIKPNFNYRNPIPKEVNDFEIIKDYSEACLTLNTSVRASAALSRRCLQSILEKNIKDLKATVLNKQIQEAIDTQFLPTSITDLLHAVREIGNISVHPTKNLESNEIIETTFEEAELNLEVIESLFDYYYVMPAKNFERKNRLNQKLVNAGRKPV